MAIIRFGPGVTTMSGSLGGNTFARTPYGCDLRTRRKPVQKRSVRQQRNKTVFQYLSNQWRLSPMTEARRQAWRQYADGTIMHNRLGEPIHLTGYQHFLRTNISRLKCGLEVVFDGPTVHGFPPIPLFVYAQAGQTTQRLSISFDPTYSYADPVGAGMYFEMAVPVKCHQLHMSPYWRFAASRQGTGDPHAPFTVFTTSPPWRLVYRQKIFTKMRIVGADGRVSNPFYSPPRLVATLYDDPEPACF